MKNYYIFIIIIILAIPVQSYSADTTLTQVKLQLKWKHQFQFAGYYAAIEQGYYKELGIEVELIEANTTESPIDALISGKVQFATSTSDIILLRAAGKPVVLLATIFQHSAQILLVSGTSKIKYVHDLSGKRLIIEPHAADIIAYMKDEGVPLNKVIQLPHSFNINMLIENKADAMTAYLTDEPFLLKQQNFDYKIFSPISGNIDFYGDILITSEQLLKDNPQLALDFRTASLKGWDYAIKNSDEIIELIYNKYSKRHSKEHLAFEAEEMKKIIMSNVVPIGYSNHRRWEKIVKIYQEIGLLDADADISGLFYTDYTNKINIPWKIIIPFSFILLFISSIAFFFYKITQKLKFQIQYNKNINNTLIKTEKQYKSYFDQGMLGMAKTSLEKGWIEVNDIICNMFGYSREEFFKLTWDKMTYPDDLEKDLLQFKRVQANEIDSYSMDKRFFRKNGDIFYSSLTVNAVRKADGSIDYMIAILNDITEQKKAELALIKSKEKYRIVSEYAYDWEYWIDTKGNFVYVSPSVERISGYKPHEFYTDNNLMLKIVYPEDKDILLKHEHENNNNNNDERKQIEFRIITRNNEVHWIGHICHKVYGENGTFMGIRGSNRLITGQKKAEQALRDSEKRWQFAVDGSELGLWDWDIPKNKVFFSKQWKKMLGYEDDEISNTSEEWLERIHPDDKEQVYKDMQKHTDGEVPVYMNEHRLRCKDGSYKWVLSKGISITTTDEGKPERMLGTHADISRQKSNEEKIKKFSTAFEQISNTIVITDINGNIEYVNPKFTKLTGYSAKEAYKQNPKILSSGTQPKEYFINLWKTILSGKTWKGEFHNKKKNGEYYWENSIITPIKNEKGEINSFIAIKEDITLRRKTEIALKESEAKFRSFIDDNKAIILEIDTSTNRILIANKAAVDFYGYPKGELINKSMNEINVLPAEEIKKIINNAVNHKVDIFRFKHKLANNEIKDVEGYPSSIKVGDKTHLLVIIFDVTVRKKAAEALKNSEAQLKELNITKDKFFSIIAHDLKSPFNTILGFSEILLEKHKEYSEKKREEMINYVNSSAVRAFKLVENLLEWSRSHSGNISYLPEKLYLKNILIETLYSHEGQANKKNIKITETIHENELVFVDENMIATVLRNLISNAIKFTPKNGNIVISSKRQTNNNLLEISVADTGVGIPKDIINDLFRIDKNISTHGTEEEIGTGLGLILCKEFVEKHNGKIWIESKEGKGSTFIFTIPRIKNKN